MSDTCRSCKALILWVISGKSGKPMPVDALPSPNGNIYLKENSANFNGKTVAYVVNPTERRVLRDLGEAYISHHATCKDAEWWRKNKTW